LIAGSAIISPRHRQHAIADEDFVRRRGDRMSGARWAAAVPIRLAAGLESIRGSRPDHPKSRVRGTEFAGANAVLTF
jgi:hypothetical protein